MTAHLEVWRGPYHDGSLVEAVDRDTLRVRLLVPYQAAPAADVRLRFLAEGQARSTPCSIASRDDEGSWWRGELPRGPRRIGYRFEISSPTGTTYVCGAGGFHHEPPAAWNFQVLADAGNPEWLRDAVLYQVFLDRFARGVSSGVAPGLSSWDAPVQLEWPASVQQFYGGDLLGLRERLDHIQAVGADVLCLTPFFPSPESHRYAASSFEMVDSLLGGNQALHDLLEACRVRDLRCIGDLTMNHCGSSHPWFENALRDRSSAETSFFYIAPDRDEYACYQGVRSLPKLNLNSAELRRRLYASRGSALQRWLQPPYGLDGWRLDVAAMIGRLGADDLNHEVAREVVRAARSVRDEVALIAEVPHEPSADIGAQAWPGALLDAGFNAPVRRWLSLDGALGTVDFQRNLQEMAAALAWTSLTSSVAFIGSHDHPRLASVLPADRLEVAFFLLFTFPSTPMVFAGDELGLTGGSADAARTPMPWAELDTGIPPALMGVVARLARLRKASAPLRRGGFRWLAVAENAVIFERRLGTERVFCAVARNACEVPLPPIPAFQRAAGQPSVSRAASLADNAIRFSAAGYGAWHSPM